MAELRNAGLDDFTPENGVIYPAGQLGQRLRQVAQLIKSPLPVEVICLDSDGWDHHESLPYYINQSLTELGQALNAFYHDMGAQMARITVIVHSEFGGRVRQNASQGVDHGTAGLCYAMGGGVNGGIVSDWPGLATQDLEIGEDLKITTDLQSVLSELLNQRLGTADLNNVFPDFAGSQSLGLFRSVN